MMKETSLDLSSSCRLLHEEWAGDYKTVSLEYTEYATDNWSSDSETSIELDDEMALKMVKFLLKSFPGIGQTQLFNGNPEVK